MACAAARGHIRNNQVAKLHKKSDMRKSVFRFKQFDCMHGGGSMKIGVDAVLVGAWADVSDAGSILDVGTGCGVIALMCAQRQPGAKVTAIDIDEASVAEARVNFAASPWANRLSALNVDFVDFKMSEVDLIVSNPPYFDSGITNPDTPRLVARHEDGLSPAVILERGASMLSDTGRIAMIVPALRFDEVCDSAKSAGLSLRRAEKVRGHEKAPVKRVLLEFCNATVPSLAFEGIPTLTLEESPGLPTAAHRALCHDFYLKY